ncbi:MAG: hypothetical protein IKX60_08955 [Bacteroidales bacterium]|nr:hypothetical protein [Bacteroidales bacterium]
MKLKFYEDTSVFYEDGKLTEEPEETLEELMKQYRHNYDVYSKGKRKMVEAARPYTKWYWINNMEPVFIEDHARNYGHRTRANAAWSDITLALATDFSSPGEITTRNAAGDKYLRYQLTHNLKNIVIFSRDGEREARKIAQMIRSHTCYKEDGIRLNIAGNGLVTLLKSGVDTGLVASFIETVFDVCKEEGVKILEVRSGGQSGVDEAGIIAAQRSKIKCSVLAPKGYRWRDKKGDEKEGKASFVKRFKEEYIDQDAWKKAKPEEYTDSGLAEFNCSNALDYLSYEIDLKIMHINAQEANK